MLLNSSTGEYGMMTSDFETKFRDAKNVLHTLSSCVSCAERGLSIDFPSIQNRVQEAVSDLTRISQGGGVNLPGFSSSVFPGPSRVQQQEVASHSSYGSVWQSRPSELQKRKAEAILTELRQALDYLTKLERRNAASKALAEKKREILGENFSGRNAWHPAQGELDLEEKERRSLEFLNRRFGQMEEESREVMAALKKQGRHLAQSHSKVGSVIEAIGLGNSTIGRIARRNNADAIIVYVGVFLLLVLMWKILVYRKF